MERSPWLTAPGEQQTNNSIGLAAAAKAQNRVLLQKMIEFEPIERKIDVPWLILKLRSKGDISSPISFC
jgi:hypothetical protein